MKFDVLIVDFPWEFQNKATGGNHKSGASQKYPTMPLGQILDLPIPGILHPNAAVFLWVPTRLKFSHAGPCMAAWGLHYETTVYWNKLRLGLGFWFRNQVEELIVCTKGDVEPFGCQLPNIISLPILEHSEKPEEFRRLVETATQKFSRRHCLEMFARRKVTGWTGIGNGVTGRDIREDMRLLARDEFEFPPVPTTLTKG